MKPLLLLVDLQRDYLDSPGLEPAAGRVVERAAELLGACRRRGVPVVHAWTTVRRDDDRRMPHWKRDGRWLCEEGTPGHEPPPQLAPAEGESVVHKTFFSPFEGEELDAILGAERPDLLLIAGVHLHGCIRAAVLDAYRRQPLDIWVAEDAVASDDPLHAATTRRYLERRAARFARVAEIVAELDGDGAPAGSRAPTLDSGWTIEPAALERAADRLEPQADELALAMAGEIGKPVRFGRQEVLRSAEMLRAVARRAFADRQTEPAGSAEVRRRPLGTVAIVTPWNNPVYIPLGKIGPALAYGNAAVWKPAPEAHGISERLAELMRDLPLTLVQGGARAAEAVMEHPAVDAVTITGSSAAGFAAQDVCGRRRIPLQAELGGNNAAIVWPDADLELAAREIAAGAFAQAGQRCTANRRLIVHGDCREQLLELVARETAALPWGDPSDEETVIGPLVSAAARDRLASLLARSGAETILPHGSDAPGEGDAWHPPTIALCDDPGHELVQHESFGPLLVVQTADEWEEAMALLDGVPQGLVAALFTASAELEERFLADARAGILKLGRSTADAEVDVPFGGWKASGIGPPEHGSFDRDFYTRVQAVYS
jgi:acyl-CoA reductase-like NAD-dependent aldehyde dehydrogenase/nicotinamidase-related amidase